MFTKAIVRTPGKSLVNGLSDSKHLGTPDYSKAIIQHQQYIEALESCGLKITVLDPCEEYPDSTFVEDVALITPKCTIMTRPGADSRRGEVTKMTKTLESQFNNLEYIESPFHISDSVYGSTFFLATGFHGLHVQIGTIFLFVCFVRLIKGHFTRQHHFGFEAAA